MEQRISLITLGVSDLTAAEAFYTALGWTPHTSVADDKGVVFFQAGPMVLSLWDRASLAEDSVWDRPLVRGGYCQLAGDKNQSSATSRSHGYWLGLGVLVLLGLFRVKARPQA